MLEPILGRNSVILLDEGAHMEQRRLMLPAFHGERMQRARRADDRAGRREVASWPRDEPVALHPRLQRLTLEIILRAVFGLERGPRSTASATCSPRCWLRREPAVGAPRRCSALRWSRTQRRFEARMRARRRADLRARSSERARCAGDDGRDDVLAMLLAARHEDDSAMSDRRSATS